MFYPPPDRNRQPPPPFATEAEMTGYLDRLGLSYSETACLIVDGAEACEWRLRVASEAAHGELT